jgi:hypothetical protein
VDRDVLAKTPKVSRHEQYEEKTDEW